MSPDVWAELASVSYSFMTIVGGLIWSNLVALLALALSVYGYWSNKKELTVEFSPFLEVLPPNALHIHNANANALPDRRVLLAGYIGIVNSSPIDLSFFDLRAFDPETNENFAVVTRKTLPHDLTDAALVLDNGIYQHNVDLPPAKYGILKANSFTYLEIVIYESPHLIEFGDMVRVSFKVPKKTFFKKDPYAVTQWGKFEFHGTTYNITGWEDIEPYKSGTVKKTMDTTATSSNTTE